MSDSPMNLYEVTNGSVWWWVIAESEDLACAEVWRIEVLQYDHDPDDLDELSAALADEAASRKLQFRCEGADDTCSMWLAYWMARDGGRQVLACSEWP